MQRSGGGWWLLAMALGAAGCSSNSGNDSDALLHDDFLVSIDRSVDDMTAAAQDAAMTDSGLKPSNHDEFYLAIRRSNLADKWFWSVYQKQTSFDGPSPNTLGTKVVRFQIQNDKLYVFDADVRRAKADVALLNAGRVRTAARDDWRAALALAERAEQQRELERLRRLTTDAR